MVAIGILGMVQGDFTPTWSGVPKAFPARVALAYLCAFISLVSGIGLLWQRTAVIASRVLLTSFLLWLLLFRIPLIFRATATGPWWASGDTAVMAAAAWVLYAWFAGDSDRQRFSFARGDEGPAHRESPLRSGVDSLRHRSFHVSRTNRLDGAGLAAMALGVGDPYRLCLHRGWPGGAHWRVCTTGGHRSRRSRWGCSRCWCGYPSSWHTRVPPIGPSSSARVR